MVSRAARFPCAFTLIEMLVVVAIIAVLAGLLLASVGTVREKVKRGRSQATLALVATAIEGRAAATGGAVAPGEHPLAGSAAPRPGFIRNADGSAVASIGEAYRVQDAAWLPSGFRPRILRNNDHFVGSPAWSVPGLYGLRRAEIGIFGAWDRRVTTWRNLPRPSSRFDADSDGLLDFTAGGADPALYFDQQFLVGELDADAVARSRAVVEQMLASEVMAELAKLKAIRTYDGSAGVLANGFVAELGTVPQWKPGTLQVAGAWHRYGILGTSVVDAWGVEILFGTSASGGAVFTSAGRDGFFRWDHGPDATFQTTANATQAAGDDRDGSSDNIQAGGGTR